MCPKTGGLSEKIVNGISIFNVNGFPPITFPASIFLKNGNLDDWNGLRSHTSSTL